MDDNPIDRRAMITARLIFAVALAFTLCMALLPKPPHLFIDPLGDKFEHSHTIATLTILACAAFPKARLALIGERLSFLGALIEVVQAMPAIHRDCDIYDWLTDTAVIIVILTIATAMRRRRPMPRPMMSA